MSFKIKTQDVDRSFSSNFMKKAAECRRAAKDSLSRGDWNAATICAVQGCISAGDALCAFSLGKRHTACCFLDYLDGYSQIEQIALEGTFHYGR